MSNKIPEIYTFLDLEMAQPSKKIIEIGAVVGNIYTGEILEKVDAIVNPNEQLSEFIIKLTGLTQDVVDNGTDLQIAYGKLAEAHIKYNSFHMPGVWGKGDVETLQEQVYNSGNQSKFIFGISYINVKTLFQVSRIKKRESLQSGLAKSMVRMGLNFQGTKHRADSDAYNTFLIFRELIK